MKFTDGYWLRSENVQASYAMQAFTVERIPYGIRIAAPERPIRSRADSLDITVLYIDLTAAAENDIAMTVTHFAGYDTKEPRFPLTPHPFEPEVTINEKEATLQAGELSVHVDRKTCALSFYGDGKFLTGTKFRNIGYMRVNKKPSKLRMDLNYFAQVYDPYMLTELSVRPGETIYGFGERFSPFVKNGQTVNIWNEDGGTASDIGYKNIPFYTSSEGYGVFCDHTGPVSYEVCSEKTGFVGCSVPGEQLRLHILYGSTPKDLMRVYTDLTGKPALVPAWSFGLWLTTSFKPSYDEATTDKLIGGMQERHIPLRVFHFDCYWLRALHWCDFTWDPDVFPDVKGMIQRYHDKGLKLCCWINPYVAQDTDMFREGAEKGYFLLRADGKGIKQVDNWQPGMALVDFTNPDACRWYADKVRGLLSAGIDALKTDFGERIPIDVKYYDGSDPLRMHNYYTYLYNKTVFTVLEEEKGEGNAVLFARSATAGSQQFPIHWGGDCEATYGSMAESLHGGLSFMMSGFSFWSHDISGFEKTATPDLYKRWAQFGLFSTHSRLHGSDTYRVPWLFDDEACDVVKYFAELKNTMMPYYFALAVEAHKEGTPVMRPMPFVFPEDLACRYLDLQYMLGDKVLVAPIFNENSLGSFYLPGLQKGEENTNRTGKWISLIDGEIKEGGRWYEEKYSYFDFPVYVREGSLLAFGARNDVPDYDYTKQPILRLYLPAEGMEMKTVIPDLAGNIAATVTAVREGNTVTFHVDGTLTDPTYEIFAESGEKRSGALRDGEQISIS